MAPLADRDIRWLALARFAAILGGSALPTALAFSVLSIEGASPSALGIVVAAAVAGQVACLLPGGVVADRMSRRLVMIVAELVGGSVSLLSGTLVVSGHATVATLAVLAAIGGGAGGFFYPAFTGFVPQVAQPEVLQSVNALLRLSVNIARILGTAVGGLIVAVVGPGAAIGTAGIAALIAAGFIALVRPRFVGARQGDSHPFADFREGWKAFTSRRWVVAVVIAGTLSNIGASAAMGVLGPLQSVAKLDGARSWAVITSALAVGTLIGAVIAGRVRPRRPLVLGMIALGLFALPMLALARPMSMTVIVIAALVAGISLDLFSVLWDTALQQNIPNESLSRVSAFDWLGSFALSPIALAVAGPLVDAYGISTVLWLAAACAATPPLALLVREVRRLRARS
ncbi:MAG: MFS transporter [Actinobacteria bacterium]|nr:MFS transporter [Actinomycetota bacterium]